MDSDNKEMTGHTAGNVHVARPFGVRKHGQNGYDYTEFDGEVVIHDVPILDTHEDDGRIAPLDKLTDDVLQSVLDATKARGACKPIVQVQHEKPDDDDAISVGDGVYDETRVYGYLSNGYIAPCSDFGDNHSAIFADVVVDQDFFEEYVSRGLLPRRSVGLLPDENGNFYIEHLALLGKTAPARPLRDMTRFAALANNRETYSGGRHVSIPYEPGENTMATVTMTDEQLQALVFDAADKAVEKYAKAKMESDSGPPKGDKPDDDDYEDDEDKDKEDLEDDPDDKKKDNKSANSGKRFKAGKDQRIANYEAKLANFQKQLDTVKAENAQLTRRHTEQMYGERLRILYSRGYKIDVDKELDRIVNFASDADRDAELDRIEQNYNRVPIGTRINRSEIAEPYSDARPVSNDADKKKAEEYASKHGVPYWQAYKITKGLATA